MLLSIYSKISEGNNINVVARPIELVICQFGVTTKSGICLVFVYFFFLCRIDWALFFFIN